MNDPASSLHDFLGLEHRTESSAQFEGGTGSLALWAVFFLGFEQKSSMYLYRTVLQEEEKDKGDRRLGVDVEEEAGDWLPAEE